MKRFSFVIAYIVLMAIPASITTYFVADKIDFRTMVIIILISMFVGGILEIWAVKQGKRDKFYIWEYNSKTTLGKKILGIAVEDLILFLILTPIFCISMWEFVKKFIRIDDSTFYTLVSSGVLLILITYFLVYRITDFPNNKR